ncbi:MAG TPA: pyridoxamine 5'-phosphate oxidase family protein [Dehalococcoidia bacterium]|nr:pyridoxamine 5'-phosphate oxidase family protein [Dehalococcoidia bacterium]
MSQTELSYEELKQEIIEELRQHRTGVLATSDGNNVTARSVLLFSDGLTIYCFTDKDSRKFKQMSVNPNVSVAAGTLQIDGIATLKGHLLDEENVRFIELHKEQNPEYFKITETFFFPRQSTRVIEITPKRIGKWMHGEGVDILNISTGKAHKIGWGDLDQSPAYYE